MPVIWSWKKQYYQTLGAHEKTSDNFFHAATIGDEVTIALFIQEKIDLNEQDETGWTALMYAAFNHQITVMKLLIEAGAGINIRNGNGETSLILTVKTEHQHITPWTRKDQIEAIKLLIEAGGDLTVKNNQGWTALKWARQNRLTGIVNILRDAGAESVTP